jgi:hypothetical protein
MTEVKTEDVAICTVASKNYLAYVRAFAESVRSTNPNVPIHVLLVDRIDGTFDPSEEPFQLLTIEDLGNIPNLPHFCFKYSALELNTAVKPYFFDDLFRRHGLKKILFFDPDILLFAGAGPLWEALERYDLILTPHLTAPYRDRKWPDELQINRAGIFNLGFLGMRDSTDTRTFLAWWKEKLYDACYMDPDRGMHVDQKWVNFAPAFFEGVGILRDPALNIAYWNLHQSGRDLRFQNNRLELAGKPAVFFHFSGLDLRRIHGISKHQNRFSLSDLPNLQPLFEHYRASLLRHGLMDSSRWPSVYDCFDNGARIPQAARNLYRNLGSAALEFGNPFRAEGEESFWHWLSTPVKGGREARGKPLVSRLWWEIYRMRPHLKRAYPDPLGRDRIAFLTWAKNSGLREHEVDARFLPAFPCTWHGNARWMAHGVHSLLGRAKSLAARAARIREPGQLDRGLNSPARPGGTGRRLPFGVNVAGYLRGEFGVAEAARASVRALEAAWIPFALNNISAPNHRQDDLGFDGFSRANPYRVNLVHVNADMAETFWRKKTATYGKGRRNIGVWFWELAAFPEAWSGAFRFYDEIWTATAFSQQCIAKVAPIPVLRMAFPAVLPGDDEELPGRSHFGLSEACFLFLFAFDFLSIYERKNPKGLLDAFRRAFSPEEDVWLVLKSINAESCPLARMELEDAARGLKVKFLDGVFSRPEMWGLSRACDAYVSLHRSEGWGLSLAQVMGLAKPVIATGYSGNMDFMDETNSFPVPYRLVELDEDYGPYPRGSVWADPDLDAAADRMRLVYENRALAASRAQKAWHDIRTRMSPHAAGQEMRDRLARLAGEAALQTAPENPSEKAEVPL